MKKLFLLILANTLWLGINAAPITLKGVVTDGANEGIPYATLSVSTPSDSTNYIKRFASDLDGAFKESIPTSGEYLLTISSIGYDNYYKTFTLKEGQSTLDLGTLKMTESSDSLAEVLVVAQKPLVKVDLDKLTYDIQSDPDAKVNNTLEMLRKVPLVAVDGQDNITVKGSSNFKVYINGKPSNIVANSPSQALKSIPASTIKEIEVITEPGAKYDAEGIGGIINIITQRSLIGYVGTVRAGVNWYGSPNAGIYFSSKMGKFGITANLNYAGQVNAGYELTMDRELKDTESPQYKTLQNNSGKGMSNFGYGSIEMSYEIDSLDLLSLSFSGHLGNNNTTSNGSSIIESFMQDTSVWYKSNDESEAFWSGLELSLDYQRTFRKPQQLLTCSYQWNMTPNRQQNINEVVGLINYLDYKQKNTSIANGNEHTFQVDYVEPFANGKHNMEVGAKYILRDNHSNNTYAMFDDATEKYVDMENHSFLTLNHMQHILSGYGSYGYRYKQFNMRLGARFEYTSQNVKTDTTFSTNYFNVVPNIVLAYQLGMTSNIRLVYTQRIQRPGIWYLNPFYDNSNPFSISQGNPDLEPTLSHSVSASYGIFTQKVNFNTSLDFTYTDNSITQITKQLNDSVLYTSFYNIGKELRTGLSVYLQWTIVKEAMIYLNAYGYYANLDAGQQLGQNLKAEGFGCNINAGSQFQLPWKLRLGAYGGYSSPNITIQGTNASFYYYGLSLSRSFLKERFTVAIEATNFATIKQHFVNEIKTDTYHYTTDYMMHFGSVGISLSYSFGEMREQIKKVTRGIKNDDVAGGSNQGGGQTGGSGK